MSMEKDQEAKLAKVAKKTKDSFVIADWALNTVTREWTYRDGTKVQLDKSDATSSAVLKDKLIRKAQNAAWPPAITEKHMQELVDAKTAIMVLLQRELDLARGVSLAKIKHLRLQ